MKKFETPELEVLTFVVEDVVTTSNDCGIVCTYQTPGGPGPTPEYGSPTPED